MTTTPMRNEKRRQVVRLQIEDLVIYTTKPEAALTKVRNLPSKIDLISEDKKPSTLDNIKKITGAGADLAGSFKNITGGIRDLHEIGKLKETEKEKESTPEKGSASGGPKLPSAPEKSPDAAKPPVQKVSTCKCETTLIVNNVNQNVFGSPGAAVGNTGTTDTSGGNSSPPSSQAGAGSAVTVPASDRRPEAGASSPATDPKSQGGATPASDSKPTGGDTNPPSASPTQTPETVTPAPEDSKKGGLKLEQSQPIPDPFSAEADAVLRQFLTLNFDSADAAMAYLQQACTDSGVEIRVTEDGISATTTQVDRAGVRAALRARGFRDEEFIDQVAQEASTLIDTTQEFLRGIQSAVGSSKKLVNSPSDGPEADDAVSDPSGGRPRQFTEFIGDWLAIVPPQLGVISAAAPASAQANQGSMEFTTGFGPAVLMTVKGETPSGLVLTASVFTEVTETFDDGLPEGYQQAPAVNLFADDFRTTLYA